MLRQSKKGCSGQTLIEAMIALSVATTAFLGITTFLSKSFFYHRVTSDNLTATYLASEGIELAKNLIDHDVYSGKAWGTCFGSGSSDVQLDYTINDCSSLQGYNSNVPLRFDPTTERYSYHATPNSVATGFARLIRVATPHPGEIDVQSVVTWSSGPVASQSIKLEDHFYDWRK
jgi:hypothetical protein